MTERRNYMQIVIEPTYGNLLKTNLILDPITVTLNGEKAKTDINKSSLGAAMRQYMMYGSSYVIYNPTMDYYRSKISGTSNYYKVDVVDKMPATKIVLFDDETGEMRIDMSSASKAKYTPGNNEELIPRIRSIGRVEKNLAGKLEYYIITIICVDLVKIEKSTT